MTKILVSIGADPRWPQLVAAIHRSLGDDGRYLRQGVHQPKGPPVNSASVFLAHLGKPCSAHALASSQG
jgi:hypothetical protein